jgi:hypothetical protein
MTKRRTKSKAAGGVEKFPINWQGIALEIRFERNWLGSPPSEFHPSHLEIATITPEREPLPITETGYLSHFVAAEDIDEAGGPVAYVTTWLDGAAKGKEWKIRVEAQRQLSLF